MITGVHPTVQSPSSNPALASVPKRKRACDRRVGRHAGDRQEEGGRSVHEGIVRAVAVDAAAAVVFPVGQFRAPR